VTIEEPMTGFSGDASIEGLFGDAYLCKSGKTGTFWGDSGAVPARVRRAAVKMSQ
jgi:hypothetical protein